MAGRQACSIDEFGVLYDAFHAGRDNPLPPLPLHYADFAIWQRSWLDGAALDEGIAYWKSRLADLPERLQLATDWPRPPVQTYAGAVCSLRLPQELADGIARITRANRATLYMTLLTGFAALLARCSGQRDIVVGTPIANRQEPQLEQLIGFFVNSLVMRVDVDPQSSFTQLLAQVRDTTLDAYQHQDVPFERIVEELSPRRSRNITPLFQVVFALQNAPSRLQRLTGIESSPLSGVEIQVRFDLELHAFEQDGSIELVWLYNRDLFDRSHIEDMARYYTALLSSAVDAPATPVGRLSMLGVASCERLLRQGRAPAAALSGGGIAALFEAQAARSPEAPAVLCGGETLSYGALNRRANRLAHRLIADGVAPETLVGIAVERSAESIIALLAILKAGGAYVPLAADLPGPRRQRLIADAGLRHIVSAEDCRTAAGPDHNPEVAVHLGGGGLCELHLRLDRAAEGGAVAAAGGGAAGVRGQLRHAGRHDPDVAPGAAEL